MDISQIEILLDIVAFVGSTVLGVLIFIRGKTSRTNQLFFTLALLIDAYIVVNYLSLHPPIHTPENQLFWIRVVMFVCSFIGPTLVLFIHTFPSSQVSLRLRYKLPLGLLMLTSATFSLTTLVFSGIQYPNGSPVPTPSFGMPVFILDFVGMFILSFIILIYKYRHATGVDRNRLLYMLVGVLVSFSMMGLTTVIFVTLLKTSSFVFLGPVFTVILMTCIAYATVKYQLFNLKVFATEVLVAALWVMLFAKIFASRSLSEGVVDVSIFMGTLIIGIYLVRSVAREVNQREQLQKLTEELAEANKQLKQLDQARADFITLTSHQLRTPPATVKWYLAAVQSGDYGVLTPEVKEPISKAEIANNSLISLIDDLLNASRIERGKMEFLFEPISLPELTKFTVEQLTPQATIKGLKLQFLEPAAVIPDVFGDKEKIRQVINNFIDNSIKYTTSGQIEASVTSDTEYVTVAVKDTGKGMEEGIAPSLFEKYSRGKDSVMHATGIGIGLYVAKIVIQNHNGQIGATSDGAGKGSIFYFKLPIKSTLPKTKTMDLADSSK